MTDSKNYKKLFSIVCGIIAIILGLVCNIWTIVFYFNHDYFTVMQLLKNLPPVLYINWIAYFIFDIIYRVTK